MQAQKDMFKYHKRGKTGLYSLILNSEYVLIPFLEETMMLVINELEGDWKRVMLLEWSKVEL